MITIIMQKEMKWAGHVADVEVISFAFRNLIGKPERKTFLRRTLK
jgi:hypothetical protein